MSAAPTVEVEPCPLKVPAALLALDSATCVIALRNWFDFAIKETTNAGQLKSEIVQRMKDQAAGLFSIDEAACIAADAIGADRAYRKKTRQAIWKAIDDGALVPLWDKARTPLPLPLTGTDKSLALIRTVELANVFKAWPLKPEPQPAPTKASRMGLDAGSGKKLPAWLDVTRNYIAGIMKDRQIVSVKVLYRALEANAGPESPFDKGTGQNLGSLYVREISATVSLKTMQNNWKLLQSLS